MGKSMYFDGANHVFGRKKGCISTFWVTFLGLSKNDALGQERSRAGSKNSYAEGHQPNASSNTDDDLTNVLG
jgi:hypothetical protein